MSLCFCNLAACVHACVTKRTVSLVVCIVEMIDHVYDSNRVRCVDVVPFGVCLPAVPLIMVPLPVTHCGVQLGPTLKLATPF